MKFHVTLFHYLDGGCFMVQGVSQQRPNYPCSHHLKVRSSQRCCGLWEALGLQVVLQKMGG